MNVIIFIITLELFSAIFGLRYIRKKPENKALKYFIWFLFFTVGVELFGFLPKMIDTLEGLSFLEDTFLSENYWMYNIYFIISYLIYIYLFAAQLKLDKSKSFLKYTTIVYALGSVSNLCVSDVYFTSYGSFTFIMGSLLVFVSVALYYLEMMNSDVILRFDSNMLFYISVGALVFHLVTTPLTIYSKYFSIEKSPDFVYLYRVIFQSANIFMYSCYIIGFIICSKKIKSY